MKQNFLLNDNRRQSDKKVCKKTYHYFKKLTSLGIVFSLAFCFRSFQAFVHILLSKVKVLSLPFFQEKISSFSLAFCFRSFQAFVYVPLSKVKVLSLPFFQEKISSFSLAFCFRSFQAFVYVPLSKVKVLSLPFFQERKEDKRIFVFLLISSPAFGNCEVMSSPSPCIS